MIKGYTLYYKDKDGYEVPVSDFGVIEIHPNESSAKVYMDKILNEIEELLSRKVIYQTTKKWFFFDKKVELVQEPLKEYQRNLYNRISKTIFIKQVSVC